MKHRILATPLVIALVLALGVTITVAGPEAATIEVSQATYLTDNGGYDRNPSIIFDGTDYWLFWTKADSGSVRGQGDYNPDGDTYVVYYKTASSLAGLPGAAEIKLALSESARPASFTQRVVSATAFGGHVYAFVSSGQDGTDRTLYYYEWNGSAWSGPTQLTTDTGGHVNVTSDGSYVYIVWESAVDGSSDAYTWDGTTLSSKIDISSDNQPKIMEMGGTLYVVSIEDSTTDIEVYSATAGSSPSFITHSTAIPAAGFYDPCIFGDGTDLYVVTAPYDSGDDRQWLVQTRYSGGSWTTPRTVSFGGYGSTYWWEYWPVGYYDGSDLYVFLTTETDNGPSYSDAEIAMVMLDWNLANDHYFHIQNAIDQATGTTINVAAGTYVEQVTVDKSLDLIGAGETTTTIQAPSLRTGTVSQGANTWDYVLAAYAPSGTIDVRVEGFTLDAAGQAKQSGTNGLLGAFLRDVDGATAGVHACTIEGFQAVEYESWGIRVYGDSDLALHGNTLSDYTRDGIVVNGDGGAGADPSVSISDNDLTGNALCLNGIQVGYGASASLTGNTVRDHTRTSPWAAVGILIYQSDGVTVGTFADGNTVRNSHYGIMLTQSDNCTVAGNDLYQNVAIHIGIDGSDNNQVKANTITGTAGGSEDKAIGLSYGATGNTIGGATPADGNTITLATSGSGLLYDIYVQGSVGAGSNAVRHNSVTGGTRFVQVDGGNLGTTTVADNTVSGPSFAGVYLNAGSAVISGNTLNNAVRPIECQSGTGSMAILNNVLDGTTCDFINVGGATGPVTVNNNAFLNMGTSKLHNRTALNVDAGFNYWGDLDPTDNVQNSGGGTIDYSPWWGGNYVGDPHTTPWTFYTDDVIQDAIDAALDGDTIIVWPGTYAESLVVDKALTLNGVQAGNAVAGRTAGSVDESILDASGLPVAITLKHSNVTFDGFDVLGDASTYAGIQVYATIGSGDLTTIDVLNSFVHGMALPNPYSTYYVTSYGVFGLGDDVSGTRRTITDLAIQGNEIYDLGGVASGSDVSGGAGVWLYGIQGGGGGGGALISGNHLHDIQDGYDSSVPEPEFGVGVAVIDDGDGVPDGGASVTGNQYDDLFGGVVLYALNSDADELGSDFSGVTMLVLNTGNLATVNEAHLAPYAKTDKPTGFPGSTAFFAAIQDAVDYSDAGATVTVSAGTFVEQVVIAKNLTLQGASTAAIIEAPDSMPACFTTSAENKPIVCIRDGATVTVDTLTIDGAGRGNSNSRFEGVAFRNAGGTVQNCIVKDVRETPFSGAQHGVAIYVYNNDLTSRTVTIWENEVHGFQKNAMALNAGDTTPLVVDVQGNTVIGAGPTDVTAQNGVQVWGALASGMVDGNDISGIAYDNTYDTTKWAATSILNYYADLDIINNTISGAHMGIYNYYSPGGDVTGNVLGVEKVGVFAYGILSVDPPDAVPSPFGVEGGGEGAANRPEATLTVDVSGNTLTFSGPDNTDTYGIEVDAGYDDDDVDLNADNNTVTGFGVGIEIYQCVSDCGAGVFTALSANGNCLSGNTYGIRSNVDYLTTDGTYNWWGDASGPYHPTSNPGGLGDEASDYVAFVPWLDACGGDPLANFQNEGTGGYYTWLQDAVDDATAGDTIVAIGPGPFGCEGHATVDKELTLKLNGRTFGPCSPWLTVGGDDVVVLGPGLVDGGGSADAGIVVNAGADNLILQDVEITGWNYGVQVVGSVTSFKMAENFVHDNAIGLLTEAGATLGGVVTIEGNLFKDNTGSGITHNGTGTLPAQYNSWGDLAGPTGPLGDGVSGLVETDNFTFAEIFMDVKPDDQLFVHHVLEGTSFDVAMKSDAAKLFGLSFRFRYDTAKLTLNSTTFSSPWVDRCTVLPLLDPDEIGYFCGLRQNEPPTPPEDEWDAAAGTIVTFNFTAFNGPVPPDNGPWPAYFDVSHLDLDTSASAIGGQKVFVNNAGYKDPSVAERLITGTQDDTVIIERVANYTGFVDLQGRLNDSLAVVEAHASSTVGSLLLASGTSASSGAYTTAHIAPYWLGVGNTYWLQIDRALYLPTTATYGSYPQPPAPTDYAHSMLLDAYPTTTLGTVFLLGGDATNENYVNIQDLSCIGADYGKTSGFTECGGAGSGGSSDVNDDGLVNIQDLSLSGGNYYKTYSPWTP